MKTPPDHSSRQKKDWTESQQKPKQLHEFQPAFLWTVKRKMWKSLNGLWGFSNSEGSFPSQEQWLLLTLVFLRNKCFLDKALDFTTAQALFLAPSEQSINIFLLLLSSLLTVTLFTLLLVLVPFLNWKDTTGQIPALISQKFSFPKSQQTPTVFLLQDVAPPPQSIFQLLTSGCCAFLLLRVPEHLTPLLQQTAWPERSCLMHL